ncbi:MAG: hypothetical protein KTR21_14620 [Rhodobacteraceae bacterium]|nr:hypothetical protein [Paracoccaceae bacterium]
MTEEKLGGGEERGPQPGSAPGVHDYAQGIYDKLERYDRIDYERIKIQEGIRQAVASWGIGALAAIGVLISAAAWISYDGVVADISDQIRADLREPISDQIDKAISEKIDSVTRRAELVASTAETALQRELDRVIEAERAVNNTLIEARTSISTLKATTDIVNESAAEARLAAENARRTVRSAEGQVADVQSRLQSIQTELDERVEKVANAVAEAEKFQARVREIVKELGAERKELRQEATETLARLDIVEEQLEIVVETLNGSLSSEKLQQLRAAQARLKRLQSLHVNFYVARIGGKEDIQKVLDLHNALVDIGIPNKARLATETSYELVAAEIDGDFTGVRRFLSPNAYMLFAPSTARDRAEDVLTALGEIAPDLPIEAVYTDFVVDDEEILTRPNGDLAETSDVIVIVKMPPAEE